MHCENTASQDPAKPLLSMLSRLGICYHLTEHEAFFTVDEGRELRDGMPGAHTKNLFLKDKKSRLVLISAVESSTVDLKSMHQRLGMSGRLSFGSPEKMWERLGVTPGSVTPFGLIHDRQAEVRFVLDEAMLAYEEVNFHPLRNTATVRLSLADFLRFMDEIGHAPTVCSLAGPIEGDGTAGQQ